MKKGYKFEPKAFLAGNIGPDSGVPSEDWSSFNPPKKITHWLGQNKKIDAQNFWNKYLKFREIKENNESSSFKTGCKKKQRNLLLEKDKITIRRVYFERIFFKNRKIRIFNME